jgi:hypothetical protein
VGERRLTEIVEEWLIYKNFGREIRKTVDIPREPERKGKAF